MKKLILLFIPLLLLLTGCGKTTDKKAEIITSFYPIYDFTKNIVGDKIDVKLMVPANQEVHDFEPSAKQVAEMTSSKVLIFNSAELENWMTPIKNKGIKIEASKNVKLIKGNPHTWLSPDEAIIEVNTISEQLQKEYPEHKDDFQKNTQSYVDKLKALDSKFQNLKQAKNKTIVTQHEAFSYLAEDYGLKQIAIAGLDPEAEPSSSTLVQLKNEIEKNQVHYVYTEATANSSLAKTLAKETGAKTATLNTVESVTDKELKAGKDYISIMEDNYQLLERTLNE